MKRFIIEQSDQEYYTSHSGLALVGLALNRHAELAQALKRAIGIIYLLEIDNR